MQSVGHHDEVPQADALEYIETGSESPKNRWERESGNLYLKSGCCPDLILLILGVSALNFANR
jgi:hypothetical protein